MIDYDSEQPPAKFSILEEGYVPTRPIGVKLNGEERDDVFGYDVEAGYVDRFVHPDEDLPMGDSHFEHHVIRDGHDWARVWGKVEVFWVPSDVL